MLETGALPRSPSTHAVTCGRTVKPLGKDIGKLVLRRHLDEPHLAVLNDLVGEVLPMCMARSRPPMTLLPHSIHAVLSS